MVARLQEILAFEAAKHFQSSAPIVIFKEYLKEITSVIDWEDEFIEEVYKIYLDEVTETGDALTQNINADDK